MTRKAGESGQEVFRLTDIVVEEVSLVDRAANQHQFLIVKRSDMAQAKDGKEGKDGSADATKAAKADAAAMRTAAVSALETLTQAVEQLGEDGDLDEEALNEVAGELRDAIQQLAEAAGWDAAKAGGKKPKGDKGGDGQPDDDDDDDAADDDKTAQRRKSNDLLKSVRDLLGKVAEQLKGSGTMADPATAASSSSATDAVTKALEGIGEALKEQGQRLGKLEKKHGLPNSAPTSERTRKQADDDDESSWPLDMNHPLDRESVDKSVSFHGQGGAR